MRAEAVGGDTGVMGPLHILSVASEVFPLIKTGGLADVAGALPAALRPHGVEMRTLVPGYPAVLERLGDPQTVATFDDLMDDRARVLQGSAAGLDLLVLDAPHLFGRPGNPYLTPDGEDWPDNGLRFGGLARVAAEIARGRIDSYRPDVVHGHDWQAAMVPAYLRQASGEAPPFVLTVHNLAFQGRFPRALLPALGLPDDAFALDGVEYYGDIGFLKAGVLMADRVTTVSPSYAAEIASEGGGMGLGGLLQGRGEDLIGILNGLDVEVWNPATDPLIAQTYDAATPARRAANKAALQARFGLDPRADAPLFGVVSRLTSQKGLDLLLAALPTLLEMGAQLALLGAGEPSLEAGFRAAAEVAPGHIGCVIGYDEALAHQIQAGCDALLVPSRFEPCGLTQLSALRYGAVPVVARTGGLADTVVDANPMALSAGVATGVQFSPVEQAPFERALHQVAALYRDKPTWARLQANAMATDVSWNASAARYAALYRQLAAQP
ncbi:glycogen synthase GlgA [Brevundimonas sp. PAMC22021]|uniref:glycogen synthase GlgA n=1 Tax=Brevundimonas sp. PAMC22021 TaxID=2861285 RepID=UPI001C63B1D2|nr:glycogen synthase GlgA [Brevundimonas sp. PAMC22021]QYF87827.1 glycogen synthase GlgA [Brevundimonas sp. PAMC22021]